MSAVEPILQENKDRFVIFPIQHKDIWEWYKKQEACFWTAEESIYTKTLQTGIINFQMMNVISLSIYWPSLAASDGIVKENLAENFSK